MVSGFGQVSKECDEEILGNWSDILSKWRKNYDERPKGLQALVRKGVPEALRGEVWQLLAGSVGDENEMINTYRLLLTKVCIQNSNKKKKSIYICKISFLIVGVSE